MDSGESKAISLSMHPSNGIQVTPLQFDHFWIYVIWNHIMVSVICDYLSATDNKYL